MLLIMFLFNYQIMEPNINITGWALQDLRRTKWAAVVQ